MTKVKLNVQSVSGQSVKSLEKKSIPGPNDNIIHDCLNEEHLKYIKELWVYYREPRDCPWARGNWMVDMYMEDGGVCCLRLPKEMTGEQVDKYIKPLVHAFEAARAEARKRES